MRQHRCQQHRNERAADKRNPLARRAVGQHRLRERGAEHQEHGQENRRERDRQGRRRRRRDFPAQLLCYRAWRDLYAAADVAAKHRARQQRHREADDQRVEQRPAGVRAKAFDRGERAGVRRHEAMRNRQPGDERYPQPQRRGPGLPYRSKEYRREQDQAHLKEHGQADEEAGNQHRPVEPFLAER